MSLGLAVIAWGFIGIIGGLVVPMLADTYSQDRVVRMCAFGALLAVAVGLTAYFVNSLFDDDGASSTFYGGGSGVLAAITFVSLFLYEKRRTSHH